MSSSAKFNCMSSGVIQTLTKYPKVPKTRSEESVVNLLIKVAFLTVTNITKKYKFC
ncbi:MAG: hypothetical protein JWQ14_3436 [Adhaeribacter sp.]|nr:hypothetical protein [Adhaeribacter sp.]